MALKTFGVTTWNSSQSSDGTSESVVFDQLVMPEDGWLRNFFVFAGARDAAVTAKVALWNNAGQLVSKSGQQTWGNAVWQSFSPNNPVRYAGGEGLFIGFWREVPGSARWGLYADTGNHRTRDGNFSDVPNVGNNYSVRGFSLTAYAEYVANIRPSRPVWEGNYPQGNGVSLNPNLEFTLPHPPAEESLDYSAQVKLYIYRTDDNTVVTNITVATTSTERTAGKVNRTFNLTLPPGVTMRAKVAHVDSWGEVSAWSTETEFTTRQAPDKPVPSAPIGKINSIGSTGENHTYTASYTHPGGLNSNAKQFEIWNEANTIKLFDSGTLTDNTSPGGNITLAHSPTFADLSWATKYNWRCRARDTANTWGAYSAYIAFSTNAAPTVPTDFYPTDGQNYNNPNLQFRLSDPDGENLVNYTIDLWNVTDNVQVSGYPQTVSGPFTSGDIVTHSATGMVLGKIYKYRVAASDGAANSPGPYSAYQQFLYANVPTCTLLSPNPSGLTNLIKEPNAEYPEGTFWTKIMPAGVTSSIVSDSDAAFGVAAYRTVRTDTINPGGLYQSEFITVDATKPYLLSAWFKKESGTSQTYLRIACYSSTNTLLGTIYPRGIALANTTDVATAWTPYGGFVNATGMGASPYESFPANTAKVKIEIFPSYNTVATVRHDAVMFAQLSANHVFDSTNEVLRMWYGYFDGDQAGLKDIDDFLWTGTPGASTSTGRNVLTVSGNHSLLIRYVGDTVKSDDRIFLQQWNGTSWVNLLNPTTWANNGDRTLIPIPAGYIKTDGRYRIKVEVKDSTDLIGSSAWAEFDVRVYGPVELPIQAATFDPSTATIRIDFTATALSSSAFNGIEIAIKPYDGEEITAAFITNPAITTFTYHMPVSGKNYRIRVRQAQNDSVFNVVLWSRWATTDLDVSYDKWFIKALDSPDQYLAAFDIQAEDEPSDTVEPDIEAIRPWSSEQPVHLIGEGRARRGSFNVKIKSGEVTTVDAVNTMEALRSKIVPRAILLMHRPDEKVFAVLKSISRATADLPWYATYQVDWEETYHIEDVYRRGL